MKTILKYTAITAFAIIGTYGIYSSVRSQKSEVMSDVMKANVEALAENVKDPKDTGLKEGGDNCEIYCISAINRDCAIFYSNGSSTYCSNAKPK